MSHFRDVVASMVKSLKEQFDHIMRSTTTGQVTRSMVKFKVELGILAQYVESQSIADTDSLTLRDLIEEHSNGPDVQQLAQEPTSANGLTVNVSESQNVFGMQLNVSNGRLGQRGTATNGQNNNSQVVLGARLKEENIVDDVVVNRHQSDNAYPMVKLVGQPIYNESLGGNIKIYGMNRSKSIRIARQKSEVKNAVRKTRKAKTVNSRKPFECMQCPKRYSGKPALQFHIAGNHPKAGCQPVRFYCNQCPAVYSHVSTLRTHKRQRHEIIQSETETSYDH